MLVRSPFPHQFPQRTSLGCSACICHKLHVTLVAKEFRLQIAVYVELNLSKDLGESRSSGDCYEHLIRKVKVP
jgi:hypothetical protein